MKYRETISVLLIIAWLFAGLFITQIRPRAETIITVTTTANSVTDDNQCSLREAVIAANTDTVTTGCPAGSGADTIVFDSSLPSPAVFMLTLGGANEDNAESGDLDLRGILTIRGTSADQIIVDGNGTDRVLDVLQGAKLTLSGVTVRNGNPGGGAEGSGIRSAGSLTFCPAS